MKVNDSNSANLSNLGTTGVNKAAEAEAASKAKGKQTSGPTEPDRVSLSNLGGTLRAALNDSPEHQAKLEKLSADVSAGRYNVDSATISKDIVKDAFEK